ncbi:MAG: hypothetical protein NTZ72_18785 [Afipia sp.]|nr:hypothetical protein [Afipia sp.]
MLLATAHIWERKKWPLVGAGTAAFLSVAGLMFVPQYWFVVCCAGVIGISCAVVLTIVLTLPALLVTPDEVPQMSAGIFAIGYSLAGVISIIGGMLWDVSQNPKFAFVPIEVATMLLVVIPLVVNFSAKSKTDYATR